jgi:CheY-like chemotaxis protein
MAKGLTSMTNTRIRSVLVVDDEADSAWAMATMLRMEGFEVRVAHDGASAVDQSAEMRPEAIIMDITMPGIDGVEAADALRRVFSTGDMPRMIAVTGLDACRNRQRVLDSGFDEFLSKPANYEDIKRALER